MTYHPHEKQGSEAPEQAVDRKIVVFRCPNGHVIRVQARLAGKKSTCPQCKAPIVVPSQDGEPVVEQTDSTEGVWHPTADLVARLWEERKHGGTMEIHHADGVILPSWYDVTWSRGTHGVFASEASDNTVTITAIAWASVEKVVIRQVKTLPADMFPDS